jgi:hypothetical protein
MAYLEGVGDPHAEGGAVTVREGVDLLPLDPKPTSWLCKVDPIVKTIFCPQ